MGGKDLMISRRGKTKNIADGPGKFCIAMDMTKKSHNGTEAEIYDDGYKPENIEASPRIGIKVGLDKNWRFYY